MVPIWHAKCQSLRICWAVPDPKFKLSNQQLPHCHLQLFNNLRCFESIQPISPPYWAASIAKPKEDQHRWTALSDSNSATSKTSKHLCQLTFHPMLYHNYHSDFLSHKKKGSSHQWFHNMPNNLLFWSKFWACYVCHFLGTAQFTTQGQATHAKDNLGLDDFKAVQALHLTIHKEFTTKFSKLHICTKIRLHLDFSLNLILKVKKPGKWSRHSWREEHWIPKLHPAPQTRRWNTSQ